MSKKNLETIFKNFLKIENLVNKKLLLCVSGGVDSRVLFNIALKTVKPQNLAVFHLDHNTRESSQNDFNFVEKLCSESNIKFFGEVLPCLQNSTKMKKGLEAFWREERKKRTKTIAKKWDAKRILTAHQASDFCETMIFRMTKGTGLSGLFPFDIATKPLWQISKSQIEAYAQENNLKWVEDPSNENLDLERNLIRKKIMPHLRKITPNLEKVFLREAQIFQNTQNFIDESIFKLVNLKNQKLELKSFQKFSLILQQEFLRKIAKKTPSFSEIEDCLKWLNKNPNGGSTKKIGETELLLNKGTLKWK